jgi:hypothetical protein
VHSNRFIRYSMNSERILSPLNLPRKSNPPNFFHICINAFCLLGFICMVCFVLTSSSPCYIYPILEERYGNVVSCNIDWLAGVAKGKSNIGC